MSWLRRCGFLGIETDSNIKRERRERRGNYKRKDKSRGKIRNRSFILIKVKSLAPNSKKKEIVPLQEKVSKQHNVLILRPKGNASISFVC